MHGRIGKGINCYERPSNGSVAKKNNTVKPYNIKNQGRVKQYLTEHAYYYYYYFYFICLIALEQLTSHFEQAVEFMYPVFMACQVELS